MMDEQTSRHLITWLFERGPFSDDAARFDAYNAIYSFLRDHADLVNTRTWTEIYALAVRTL